MADAAAAAQLKFDIAIDLQCLTKSAITAWLSGAPRRIGKSGEDGRELSQWFNNELVEASGTHVMEHYLSMLRPLGIDSPALKFDMPERAAEAEMVERFLQTSGLAGRRFAVLNPGAGWPSKIWPAERYGALARHLHEAHGVASIAAWGLKSELPLAETIVAMSARARPIGAAHNDDAARRTLPAGRAVCRLRYRADAFGGCRRHAHDQHARTKPGRLVRRVRQAEHSAANSLRGRHFARATRGRRPGDARDNSRNGGARM